MSLANQKEITEYQEAIQATEDLESPAVSFAKTSDYKEGLAVQVNAVIKQNNTLLYLATKQSQKIIELEEKFDKLKQEIHTIVEKEVQHADLEDSISSLAKRLDSFSISGKLPNFQLKKIKSAATKKMARNRHQVARTTRRVFGRSNYNRTLETAVDPEGQLEISRERRANLVPAEVLYSNNRSTARHRVYEHYSEQRILTLAYPLGDIHDKATRTPPEKCWNKCSMKIMLPGIFILSLILQVVVVVVVVVVFDDLKTHLYINNTAEALASGIFSYDCS
ncbi:hypothetical protein Tco_1349030 [Tanacetum coccineum]